MTTTEARPVIAGDSPCGPMLWGCRCRGTTPTARPGYELEQLHRAAVERAQRSGWDSAEERLRVLGGER